MEKRLKVKYVAYLLFGLLLISTWPEFHTIEANDGVQFQDSRESIQYQSEKWAVLPRWETAPVIDGKLDDSQWQNAPVLEHFTTAFYNHSLPENVQYRVAYDDQYLYIGGHLAQAEAETLSQIEFVIRPSLNDSTFYVAHIPLDTATSPALSTIWNPSLDVANLTVDIGRQNIESMVYESFVQEETLSLEITIPLSDIVPAGVTSGDEWQLNIIHVHNLYTQPLSSWIPIRQSNHWDQGGPTARLYANVIDQDRLGSIYFDRLPESLVAGTSEVTEWFPENTEGILLYKGFNNKQLNFSLPLLNAGSKGGYGGLQSEVVQLRWKEPGRSWQTLDEYELDREDSLFTLDFEHPAPRQDGIYRLQIVLTPKPSTARRVAVLTFDREDLVEAGSALYRANHATEPNDPAEIVEWTEPTAVVQSIMDLIPEQPGFRFVGLPEMPDLYPDGLYQLSADGQSLVAPRTGTVYPNEQFKEDQELIVTNGKGETVTIPYYEDEAGNRYFITAHMWYLQKQRAISQTVALAKTDPLGAARLLYKFAQMYEGYNPTVDRVSGNNHINHSASKLSGPPYAYWGGIWDRWFINDLSNFRPLLTVYSDLKATNALEVLSQEVGEDVEERIVQKMIIPSAEFALSFVKINGNLSFRLWYGLIEVGKALQEPDYVHRAIELVENMVSSMFLSDGYWQEVTQSYHVQIVNEMNQVLNQLRGWSDPEGYVSPRTGLHLNDLDMAQSYPIIAKALEIGNKLVYPNGKVLPIMDTWASGTAPQPQINAGSYLLPNAGIGRLVGGQGLSQTQVYLGFQPKYGHAHYDPLNLSLYAQGQELLPDLGYSHSTFYRWFTLSTMAHNTVVVDSSNMINSAQAKHGGNIETYIPDGGAFQVMRASYESAYEVTEEYSREPWFVPFADGDGEQGYVLDLFRVSGGSRHEYTLQGDANHDAYFATDLKLNEYGPYLLPPGTEVVEPVSNSDSGRAEGHYPGYVYVRDVQQAELVGEQYSMTLVTETNGVEKAKMKITGLLDSTDDELYLGRSPSLRSIRLNGSSMDNNDEAVKYTMPKLVHRREGTDLHSTFVTVLEPYAGYESHIEAIDRLLLDQAPEGAVAVKIVYGDTTDILLSNPNHPEQPLVAGDITLLGELGFIRLVNGEVREMELVGGTLLKKGQHEVNGSGVITGVIQQTLRQSKGDAYDALVTDLSISDDVIGKYVIVQHPDQSMIGYEIGDVLQSEGATILVLAEHDPGFEIHTDGTTQQMFYPGLSWVGLNTFKIVNIDRVEGLEEPDPFHDVLQAVQLFSPQRHLVQGETVPLTVYGTMTSGNRIPIAETALVFTSSDVDVLYVNEEGVVTANGEGTALITVEMTWNGITKSSSIMMSVQNQRDGEPLLIPPLLQRTVDVAHPGSIVEYRIHDDPLWRENIVAMTVNGISVSESVYTILEDRIILSPEVFVDEGQYWIAVHADGYRHATVDQHIVSTAALRDLDVSEGTLSPTFHPGTTEYAIVVDQHIDLLYITGITYAADATIEAFGQTFHSGMAIPIHLDEYHHGHLDITVHTSNGITKTYTLLIQRSNLGKTGDITGTVYDPNHLPASGATVHLTGNSRISVMTDEKGTFTLSQIPIGMQRVTATMPGYAKTVSESVYVQHNQSVDVSLAFSMKLPPVLLNVMPTAIIAGEVVEVKSSDHAFVYLVPADTSPHKEDIEAVVENDGHIVYGVRTRTMANVSAALDTTYLGAGKYKVYAIGDNGLVSAGKDIIIVPTGVQIIEDTDFNVTYGGRWNLVESSNYTDNTIRLGLESGSYVEIVFHGTSAKVISDIHRVRGKANIYVDGEYTETIDFYSSVIRYQQELFDTGELEEGIHTIRIEAIWEKHPDSTNYYITFDALRVGTSSYELSGYSTNPLKVGDPVFATSPRDGTLYLVPADTLSSRMAIETAGNGLEGRFIAVMAHEQGVLNTAGLSSGLYKVYGIDQQGRVSVGSDPIVIIDPLTQPEIIEDTDFNVTYGGRWNLVESSNYTGNTIRLGTENGAYVEIIFYGTSAQVISDIHRVRGKANVYVDGEYTATIDFYSPIIRYRQELFDTGLLEEGLHTIRIEAIWEKHSDSTNYFITFDALRVQQ